MSKNIKRLREAAKHVGRNVDVLLDLSGSKVRMGNFARKSVVLRKGSKFTLTSRNIVGDGRRVSINIPEILAVIKVGDVVLLAMGH
jgi:pyruvate kinase